MCNMSDKVNETIVMSVGGSLIVPDQIDTTFLKNLHNFIIEQTTNHGRRFVIIAGGGRTARRYQDAAREVADLEADDLDWMGIHSTRLNGHLLRTIFRDIAHPVMVTNPDDVLDAPKNAPLIIAAGYRPGASTDLRAVQIAQRVGAKKVVNLSNTDYIYSENPKDNPDATKFETISWTEFRKLIPDKWDPGLSSPFDPVAAQESEKLKLEVASINGKNLEQLKLYLDNQTFVGTKIFH